MILSNCIVPSGLNHGQSITALLSSAADGVICPMLHKFLFAAGLAAACAQAQNISKFVISEEAAKKTLVRNEISADTAAKITQACVDWATKNNQAVSIFILSPTGQIVHAHRMDGQVPINTETALLKA